MSIWAAQIGVETGKLWVGLVSLSVCLCMSVCLSTPFIFSLSAGIKLRALHMLGKCSTTEPHNQLLVSKLKKKNVAAGKCMVGISDAHVSETMQTN